MFQLGRIGMGWQGKSDRATQVEIDRGILNIENINKKKEILKREEKKEDFHSLKTTELSLSGTERKTRAT